MAQANLTQQEKIDRGFNKGVKKGFSKGFCDFVDNYFGGSTSIFHKVSMSLVHKFSMSQLKYLYTEYVEQLKPPKLKHRGRPGPGHSKDFERFIAQHFRDKGETTRQHLSGPQLRYLHNEYVEHLKQTGQLKRKHLKPPIPPKYRGPYKPRPPSPWLDKYGKLPKPTPKPMDRKPILKPGVIRPKPIGIKAVLKPGATPKPTIPRPPPSGKLKALMHLRRNSPRPIIRKTRRR